MEWLCCSKLADSFPGMGYAVLIVANAAGRKYFALFIFAMTSARVILGNADIVLTRLVTGSTYWKLTQPEEEKSELA